MSLPVLPLPTDDFARRLTTWFTESARDLPWRRSRDPYPIWISEVMLQQTQVTKVVPYFERFMATFPTLADLAAAPEEEILGLWSGLGYYSRARNLKRAARRIVDEHGGRFPENPAEAQELPGVGRYTAGAVLSQAYGLPLPVLDGNVRRVLARLLAIDLEPGGGLDRHLWALLEETVGHPLVRRNPADFNQALMELGALVCRPSGPECHRCPLEDCCLARRAGLVDELPRPRRRRPTEEFHFTSAVIRQEDRFLMRRSSGESYLQGFWEFPRVAGEPSKRPPAETFASEGDVAIDVQRLLPPIKHHITFRRIYFHPVVGRLKRDPPADCRWLEPSDPALPTSSYIAKILATVRSPRGANSE